MTTRTDSTTSPASSSGEKKLSLAAQIYNGEGDFQIVQNRKKWFAVMGIIFLLCIVAIGIRGFALGIDFEGGTRISMPPSATATEESVAQTFEEATGVTPQSTTTVGSGDAQSIEINSSRLSEDQIREARSALFDEYKPKDASGQESQDVISASTVSESWGSTITNKMLLALGVFLLVVFLYIAFRLERDMAFAAIICLIMDMTVVSGIYALVGFEVSPATVIGLLTILAYSLYDTVVVFDKVHENTAGLFSSRRATYEEQVNLSVNQTIMRSINTSIFSLVPIASLLVVAVGILGVGTLKDLALVQFFGVIAGTFSSIFFAAPLLVAFKLRTKKYKQHTARVLKAREEGTLNTAAAISSGAESISRQSGENESDASATAQRVVVTPEAQATASGRGALTEPSAYTSSAHEDSEGDVEPDQTEDAKPSNRKKFTDESSRTDGQTWRPGM